MTDPSFKSNQYALHALRERRATMAGEMKELQAKLRNLRDSLVHMDATLRLFDPDADPSTIPAKKPYKRVKLFGQGKLNRMILDALRKGDRPMSTAEVVQAVVDGLGYGPDATKGMSGRVRANLLYLSKVRGLVVKEGERETARWRLDKVGCHNSSNRLIQQCLTQAVTRHKPEKRLDREIESLLPVRVGWRSGLTHRF